LCDDSCIFLVTTQSTGGIDPASLSPAPPRSATQAAMPQIGPTPVPASRRRRSRALRRRSTGRRRARPRPIRVPLRSCWPTTPSPVRDVDEDDDALTAYQIFSLPGLHLLLSPYYVSTKATLYFSPHSKQHLSRASLQKKKLLRSIDPHLESMARSSDAGSKGAAASLGKELCGGGSECPGDVDSQKHRITVARRAFGTQTQ